MAQPPRAERTLPAVQFALGALITACAMSHELVIRQPALYAFGGHGPPAWLAPAGAALGAASGLWLVRGTSSGVVPALLACSAVSAASGPAWFWAAEQRSAAWSVALGVPGLAGLGAAWLAVELRREIRPSVSEPGAVAGLLHPFRLLSFSLLAIAAAALASSAGVLRSGVLLGVAFGALAAWWASTARGSVRLRVAAFALLASEAAGLAAAQHALPLGELRQFVNPIVFAAGDRTDRVVVTTGQDAFEVFVAGTLSLSSLDGYRYAEALVHPAFRAAPRHARVLVLEPGTGAVTREVLRWPGAQRVDVVADSAVSAELARSAYWLRGLTASALASPRVRLAVAEAAPWLEQNAERYDVIVADLADPVDHVRAKHHTRYFFWLLGEHLAEGGVLAVQAGSALVSRSAHAAIVAAFEGTGLRVLPYAVGVPTLGEWSLLLGSASPIRFRHALPRGLAFLDEASFDALFRQPPAEPSAAAPALLHHQVLVEAPY